MKCLNPARKSKRVKKGLPPAHKETRKTLKALMCQLRTHVACRNIGGATHTTARIYQEPNTHWSYEIK